MKRCVSSFVTADGRAVAAGELVEDSDPVIQGREVLFSGMEVSVADADKPTPDQGDQPAGDDGDINFPPHVDQRAELREAEEKAEQENSDTAEDDDDTTERADVVEHGVVVEEATAAPGERRNTTRSRKG